MASTSYLARIIFAEFDGDVNEAIDFAGTYNLLVRAKSIPAPASALNTVESTTLEDDTQTFEMGIKTSDSKEVTGNLEKTYLQAINKLSGKKLKIMQLYGTDGIGGVAKYAYIGQATATPSDVGGTDEILEMSATIIPNTSAVECTDDYKVVDNEDGTFAVTKVGGITSPDIEIPAAGQELYGKTVGDMVENGMEVLEDGTVKGTFKYVTDYTGFNGSEPDEQEGYLILSRLVDTFISRISLTMLPVPNPHNTVCVLSWEEARHWQSRSSGYSSS